MMFKEISNALVLVDEYLSDESTRRDRIRSSKTLNGDELEDISGEYQSNREQFLKEIENAAAIKLAPDQPEFENSKGNLIRVGVLSAIKPELPNPPSFRFGAHRDVQILTSSLANYFERLTAYQIAA